MEWMAENENELGKNGWLIIHAAQSFLIDSGKNFSLAACDELENLKIYLWKTAEMTGKEVDGEWRKKREKKTQYKTCGKWMKKKKTFKREGWNFWWRMKRAGEEEPFESFWINSSRANFNNGYVSSYGISSPRKWKRWIISVIEQ